MTFAEKIRGGEKTIGMHINLNDIAVSRIAAAGGYDFVWIDMEHSYLTLENLYTHITVLQSHGTAAVVRVPQDDLTYTKKVLEMGPDGIIFPMVHSAEEAKRLIDVTLYPPYGTRGFGPIGAVNYGMEDALAYVSQTKTHLCRFVQIEHIGLVRELDAALENPYIDGFIIGPYDLSGSIGKLGDVFSDAESEIIRECAKKIKAKGKSLGVSTGDISDEVVKHWCDLGVDMLSAGTDFTMLQDAVKTNVQHLRRIHLS